mmetsp:Transcript_2775/g.7050  ORF Transcript_2775/g.7050 Transcript_2775/m.7050 type:complete len:242 (+) Transcript_2775:796-1521(+)
MDILSDREALFAKAAASSAHMGPLCRSTPTDVVGHTSDQSGSQPFRTSCSSEYLKPNAFAAIATFSSGSIALSSHRRNTSASARARATLKEFRCSSSIRCSSSCRISRSITIFVSSAGLFLRTKLAKQDAAALRTWLELSSKAPATDLSIPTATDPPMGMTLARSAHISAHMSQTPTRVFAPTPRCSSSRDLGARTSAFSVVIRGTIWRKSFMESLSRDAVMRADSNSWPFFSSFASTCSW